KAELTNKEISKLQFVPCRQRDCYTKETVKGDGEYERIMDFERSLSNGVNIDDDGYVRPEGEVIPEENDEQKEGQTGEMTEDAVNQTEEQAELISQNNG
nr:hypothetical protein [Lachnospiraceae bacterium]